MSKFKFYLFLNLFLLAQGGSHAASIGNNDWIKIDSGINADTYINKKSIVAKKDEFTAWTKYELSEPVQPNSKTKMLWKDNIIAAFSGNRTFDCKMLSHRINTFGIYNEKNEFIEAAKVDDELSKMTIAAPGTALYSEISKICNFMRSGSIDKSGWNEIPRQRYQEIKNAIDEQRSLLRAELENGNKQDSKITDSMLKKLGSINFLENRVEVLAANENIYAIEYTTTRYINSCTAIMKDSAKKFNEIIECQKAKIYANKNAELGSASSALTLTYMEAFYANEEEVDFEKLLTKINKIDKSKLDSKNISNLEFIRNFVTEKLRR